MADIPVAPPDVQYPDWVAAEEPTVSDVAYSLVDIDSDDIPDVQFPAFGTIPVDPVVSDVPYSLVDIDSNDIPDVQFPAFGTADEKVLAELAVLAITPASGMNTGVVNITNLAGSGFDVGAVVKLKLSGQTDITASSVVIVHQAQIQCTFDLTGAAIGKWDVEVTV